MKKNIFIGIIVIILVIFGGWIFFNKDALFIPQDGIETSQSEIKEEVSLTIDDGEGLLKIFKSEFKEGVTVFDLLKESAEESGLILKTKTYDVGVFVEAIGDKENGQDEKYWLYYVNEEMAMVAADKKEIKPGDEIKFKFEKSPF